MDDQMRDAMRQRVGLAGAGPGHDQQRTGFEALGRADTVGQRLAIGYRPALGAVELRQM